MSNTLLTPSDTFLYTGYRESSRLMDQTTTSEGSVYSKTIHSGKWFLIGSVLQKTIHFFGFVILARLLLPSDYGVIAIVFLVTSSIDFFLAPGFGTALLQKKHDIEHYLDTVWTFDLLKAILIAGVILFSGGYIADFFKISDYRTLISLSGIFVLLTAGSNRKQIYFFRDLQYKQIFLRDMVSQFAYVVCSVLWALFVEASVMALFIGQLARYISSFFMSYTLYPNIPRLNFHFSKLRDLFQYSKWIYAQNLINYFSNSLDKILIGRLLNSADLGYYSRAKDIPAMFVTPISDIFKKIGFSAFAKIQGEFDKVRLGFMKSLDIVTLVSVPMSLLFALEGGVLVETVLGGKWLLLVIPLKIIAFGYIFWSVTNLVKSLFNAIGKPKIVFRLSLLQLIITPALVYYGVTASGLKGAAVSVVIVWFMIFLYSMVVAKASLHISFTQLMPTGVTIGTASVAILVADVLARDYVHTHFGAPLQLLWIASLALLFMIVLWIVSRAYSTGPWYTLKSVCQELGIRIPF